MKNPHLNREAAIAVAQAVMDEGRIVKVGLIHPNGEAYEVVVTLENHVYTNDVWDILSMKYRHVIIGVQNAKVVLHIR